MLETREELAQLQELMDASMAAAGPHISSIITAERRLTAAQLCEQDGRPLAGPVDGYLLHGSFWFSSGRDSVRMRHLAARPAISATHIAGEHLAVTMHGTAEVFAVSDPAHPELRQAMLDHYLPIQGPDFERWLDGVDALGARIRPAKVFTFSMPAA